MSHLDDEQRSRVYRAMLRGLADTAQNQLCAKDEGHAWGPWERTAHHHDIPLRFNHGEVAVVCNEVVKISARRTCLNCGKQQNDL